MALTTDEQREDLDEVLEHMAASPLAALLAKLVECELRHACAQAGACFERRR